MIIEQLTSGKDTCVKKRGKFIVFEGLDGCGKSTQLENLRKRLSTLCKPAQTRKVFVTREPSDSVPGLICRGISKKSIFVQSETEALLYAADRYEHIRMEILPQLEVGNHVLCDRYYFSNFAYQSTFSSFDNLLAYNKVSINLLQADATIFINVSPEECERRRAIERATEEKYENIEGAKIIMEQYEKSFNLLREQENVLTVDGMGDSEQIFEDLWIELSQSVFCKDDYK